MCFIRKHLQYHFQLSTTGVAAIMNAVLLLRTKAIDHVIVMLMLFMCSVYSIEVSIVVQQQNTMEE